MFIFTNTNVFEVIAGTRLKI